MSGVKRYRLRPVVVEAVRAGGSSSQISAILKWMSTGVYVEPAVATRDIRQMHLPATSGDWIINPGDWVVKDENGDFWPAKTDFFEKSYEETT